MLYGQTMITLVPAKIHKIVISSAPGEWPRLCDHGWHQRDPGPHGGDAVGGRGQGDRAPGLA